MKSMTGYGRATWDDGTQHIEVEIRAVNSRYFHFSAKLPTELLAYEQTFRKIIAQKLKRGSISLTITYQNAQEQDADVLNLDLLEKYYLRLLACAQKLDTDLPQIDRLLSLPGVINSEVLRELSAREQELLIATLREAITKLDAMRVKEGEEILRDLQQYCQEVEEAVKHIEQQVPQITARYQQRLESRIKDILEGKSISFAQEDILKEVAIFAEKSDVSEELSRLSSHCKQFAETLSKQVPVGKTLEFILQEMLREVNTIASKSNDSICGSQVIQAKAAIEKTKEQLQNVE